jgi:hypothetical protein
MRTAPSGASGQSTFSPLAGLVPELMTVLCYMIRMVLSICFEEMFNVA